MRVYLILAVLSVMILVPHMSDAFGHGLGGDVAPPLDLGGRDVTVSAQLTPADLEAGNTEEASIEVKFFDVEADENFEDVTYNIEIWHGTDLIARNLFFDEDGALDITLRTEAGCEEVDLWKCTKYYGTEHPLAPGALYAQGQSNVTIQGPIFDQGGLYNIKVGIAAATSARTVLAEPLNYDTFISVADVQPFTIRTAQAEEVPATIKTYYDKVSNISYDDSRGSLSFEMPFDWSPDYVELVQIVHEEVHVPKSFTTWSPDREFAGYVDGVRLDKRVLIIDPYTYDDRNVIHFLVTTAELERINSELGAEHEESRVMNFELVPENNVQKNTSEFYLVDSENHDMRTGATVTVSWDANVKTSPVPLEIAFLDESGDLLRDTRYGYVIADHATGAEVARSLQDARDMQDVATEGITIIEFDVPGQGTYRFDLVMYGQGRAGLDVDDAYAGLGSGLLEFGVLAPSGTPGTVPTDPSRDAALADPAIPGWIKDSVGWWADGITTDAEFVSALEFLISEDVIKVAAQREAGAADGGIPGWIKDSAGWWADGITTDAEFVNSLEFLIQKGIIVVGEA